jgi:hypothetical protein
MNNNASLVIQNHLEPRESILWSGQPKQGVMLRGSDAFMIPFSLLWGGFAFFWEYSVLTSGAPLFFALFGIPFVVMGVYLIIGRFFVEAKQREKIFYGVTTDRVIIISGLFQQKVKSLFLRTLSDLSLMESRDGTGSISFGSSFPFASWFGGMPWPGMEQFTGPRLDTIDSPRQVYQIIREAQKNAT